jgi:hypothetical protein
MMRVTRWLGLSVLVAAAASGCASARGPAGATTASASPAAAAHPPGERLWRSKCGACHVPVEPQSRDRGYLETALARHRVRLRLTEPEWTAVVDFLAKPPGNVATSR